MAVDSTSKRSDLWEGAEIEDSLRPRLGVSSCLLGENVRYDGNHKRHGFLVERLAPKVELVPVCPEVELGLGIPREPIQLVRQNRHVRLRTIHSQKDLTAQMKNFAAGKLRELARLGLDGYVLKSRSPSCGLTGVTIQGSLRLGQGRFAQALERSLEDLPLAEEIDLDDPETRDLFLVRLYAHSRINAWLAAKWTLADLVRFHAAHKLLLLAHEPASHRRLGRLVAQAKSLRPARLAKEYRELFLRALCRSPSRGRQVNVLEHIAGYFRRPASAQERTAIRHAIAAYRRTEAPLAQTRGLLHRLANRYQIPYLQEQIYFQPYPEDLLTS